MSLPSVMIMMLFVFVLRVILLLPAHFFGVELKVGIKIIMRLQWGSIIIVIKLLVLNDKNKKLIKFKLN